MPLNSFMRRRFLAASFCVATSLIVYDLLNEPAHAQEYLNVTQAYEQSQSGAITLLDIRRPDEWAQTGSAKGAARLDMRRRDFIAALDQLVGGDRNKPIAVICARGVRSNYLSQQLIDVGFTQIMDVPEGMLGSRDGPGWLRAGLPVTK